MWGKLAWHCLIAVILTLFILTYGWAYFNGQPADWYIWFMALIGGVMVLCDNISDAAKAAFAIVQERRVTEQIERDIAVRDWLERRR
jgi:hypothetical protein